MYCIKCNATLGREDLTNCPYCQALISSLPSNCENENILIYEIQNKTENEYQQLNKLMKLIVENYSPKIYLEPQRLSAIIGDLFPNGQIKCDIREVINFGVTIQIYDIYDSDEIFNEDYIELVQNFVSKTDINSKVVISLIDLLFFGVGIEFTVDESKLVSLDIANEVLNSVLNKSSSDDDDDDFASSVLEFINNK